MQLRPLGSRILVRPDEQEAESVSGLILPEDRHHVPTSGTVIEVGEGPAYAQKVRTAVIARCQAIVRELAGDVSVNDDEATLAADILNELARYRNQKEPIAGSVQVGDRVVFPVECGLNCDVDGVRHLILNEDDVAVIAVDEEVAA